MRSDRVIQAATGCHQLPPLHRSGCQKGEGGINFPRQLAPASTLNINTLFLQLAFPITTHYYSIELETKVHIKVRNHGESPRVPYDLCVVYILTMGSCLFSIVS